MYTASCFFVPILTSELMSTFFLLCFLNRNISWKLNSHFLLNAWTVWSSRIFDQKFFLSSLRRHENGICSEAFGFHRSFISLGPKSSVLSVCFWESKDLSPGLIFHGCRDCVLGDHVFVLTLSLLVTSQQVNVWRPCRTTQRRGPGCVADRILPLSPLNSLLRLATAVIPNSMRKVTLQRNWS